MKKTILYTIMAVSVFALTLSSCNKVDEDVVPTVSSVTAEAGMNSVTLNITAENATGLAYLRINDMESAPSGQAVISAGTSVDVENPVAVVEGLEPGTTYYFAVAAVNGSVYSNVVTTQATTLEEPCTFELIVTGSTSNALAYSITPSVEDYPYYVAAVSADLVSASDADIHAAVLEQIESLRGQSSLSEYLTDNMYTGTRNGMVAGLQPETSYLVVAMGLSVADGALLTDIAKAEGTTEEEVQLTFDLTVDDITATTAHVTVTPSDMEATYVWLCQPAVNYPTIDVDNPDADALAQEYVNRQGMFLEQGMGLYTGSYDLVFDVNSDSYYFLFAFGYTPGIGITSPCELFVFETAHGMNADDFKAEIEITVTTARRMNFTVTPGPEMENIWYYPALLPVGEYSWEAAQDQVYELIYQQYELNLDFNPGYTMTDAVSSVCYRGVSDVEASGLEPETEYVIAIVAMHNDGTPGNSEVTTTGTTKEDVQSTATFTHKIYGIYDGNEAMAAGIFSESGNLLSGNALVVFEIEISDDAVHCYYNSLLGNYSDPEEEYKTDDDLMSWVPDNIYTVEVEDHSTTHLFVPMSYVDKTYNDYTFLTWANDADGVWGPVCRTFISIYSTEVEDVQGLVDLVNDLESTSVKPTLQPLK